ncbi:MAG: hypothetical protein Q8O76_05855 [Chloroflexota bacterium]|nr:hypothetical protein [Chloroflexota bacterium]
MPPRSLLNTSNENVGVQGVRYLPLEATCFSRRKRLIFRKAKGSGHQMERRF